MVANDGPFAGGGQQWGRGVPCRGGRWGSSGRGHSSFPPTWRGGGGGNAGGLLLGAPTATARLSFTFRSAPPTHPGACTREGPSGSARGSRGGHLG